MVHRLPPLAPAATTGAVAVFDLLVGAVGKAVAKHREGGGERRRFANSALTNLLQ